MRRRLRVQNAQRGARRRRRYGARRQDGSDSGTGAPQGAQRRGGVCSPQRRGWRCRRAGQEGTQRRASSAEGAGARCRRVARARGTAAQTLFPEATALDLQKKCDWRGTPPFGLSVFFLSFFFHPSLGLSVFFLSFFPCVPDRPSKILLVQVGTCPPPIPRLGCLFSFFLSF